MNTGANNHDQALINRDKKQAEAYLKTKNVKKLINYLTTKLLVNKPYNPVNYTIFQLEELINFRKNQSHPPVLYNDEQLTAIFNSMDIMKTGSLDLEQYVCVMKMLGLNEGDFNTDPERDSNNQIDRKTFMRKAWVVFFKSRDTNFPWTYKEIDNYASHNPSLYCRLVNINRIQFNAIKYFSNQSCKVFKKFASIKQVTTML